MVHVNFKVDVGWSPMVSPPKNACFRPRESMGSGRHCRLTSSEGIRPNILGDYHHLDSPHFYRGLMIHHFYRGLVDNRYQSGINGITLPSLWTTDWSECAPWRISPLWPKRLNSTCLFFLIGLIWCFIHDSSICRASHTKVETNPRK